MMLVFHEKKKKVSQSVSQSSLTELDGAWASAGINLKGEQKMFRAVVKVEEEISARGCD